MAHELWDQHRKRRRAVRGCECAGACELRHRVVFSIVWRREVHEAARRVVLGQLEVAVTLAGLLDRQRRSLRAAVLLTIAVGALFCALDVSPTAGDAVPISPGSWTLAVLPDTQIYAQSYPQHYTAQTQWIRDHIASHNIKYVLHEGDITNNNVVAQWN